MGKSFYYYIFVEKYSFMTLTNIFTVVACAFIVLAFVIAFIYIVRTRSYQLDERRKWIEQLPSVISTLGVLGTFLGITLGLIAFDSNDPKNSIPPLLKGLRMAFLTSILGMVGSLILNRMVSRKFDTEKKKSEIDMAAEKIVAALKANHQGLTSIMEEGNRNLVGLLSQDETVKIIRQDVEQMKDDLEELKGLNQEIRTALQGMSSSDATVADELSKLRAVAMTATASISTMDNHVDELLEKAASYHDNK